LNDADENSEKVAELAKRFKYTVGERADVGSETEAENIERVDFAGRVSEADEIDGAFAIFQ